jgi:hypothetical protein
MRRLEAIKDRLLTDNARLSAEVVRLREALETARYLLGMTPEQFAQAGFPSTSTDE